MSPNLGGGKHRPSSQFGSTYWSKGDSNQVIEVAKCFCSKMACWQRTNPESFQRYGQVYQICSFLDNLLDLEHSSSG
uniref:Uncharacterized protein n=1 Tax=Lepeophtheirus salmonis TaxID=72036 RepID=A0A0K2VG86_LEPSM